MMGHIKWGTLNKQENHLLLLYLPGAQNQFSVNLVCSLQIASIHGTPQKFNIYQQSMTYSACCNYQKIPFQFILLPGTYGILSLTMALSQVIYVQSQCCAYGTSNQLHVTSSKTFLAGAKIIKIKFVYIPTLTCTSIHIATLDLHSIANYYIHVHNNYYE